MPREIAQLGQAMRAASAQLAARENRQTLLIAELNHRVKNTLATVQAMATLTARGTASIDSYRQSLEGRLLALSKTHNLLTEAFWETVTLSDLLRNELAPFDDGSGARVVLDGPAVSFIPRVAVALGMAMHELTTNAAKYGSLSVPGGRVEVRWSLSPGRAPYTRLRLDWTERDGPAVALPEHRGFGSRLIWQSIARELDGELCFDYPVEGLRCAIVIDVSAAGPTAAERGEGEGDLPRAAEAPRVSGPGRARARHHEFRRDRPAVRQDEPPGLQNERHPADLPGSPHGVRRRTGHQPRAARIRCAVTRGDAGGATSAGRRCSRRRCPAGRRARAGPHCRRRPSS